MPRPHRQSVRSLHERNRFVWAAVLRGGFSVNEAEGIHEYARANPFWRVHVDMAAPSGLVFDPVRPPDGFIAPVHTAAMAEIVWNTKIPVVDLSDVFWNRQVPRVLVDDVAIGKEAAKHLKSTGFDHYAAIGYSRWNFGRRRLDAFRASLGANVNCEVLDCVHADEHARGGWPEADRKVVAHWLRGLPKPCGIFVMTDLAAAFIVRLCGETGIKVPDEAAILGVGNDRLICESGNLSISSVVVPWTSIGFKAAECLDRVMRGEPVSSNPILVQPVGVQVRQSTETTPVSDPLVRSACRLIREHSDKLLSVGKLARMAGISRRKLERHFRGALRRTVRSEIHRVRLEKAKRLLASTDLPVRFVAAKCGFGSASHFGVVFRQTEGKSPTDFRRSRPTSEKWAKC